MSKPITDMIKVSCPICSKKGKINIDNNLIMQNTRGITAINIIEKTICEHSFIAYIDKNLVMRDAFACDFRVELPKIVIMGSLEKDDLIDFDMDIVKYNLLPTLLTNIFRGVIFQKRIAILNEFDYLNKHFTSFFHHVLDETFNHDITFIEGKEYKKNKKSFKDYLVLKGNEIIDDNRKTGDPKTIKIINMIIQKFFNEFDSKNALIILKNEIMKLYKLSQDLIELNNDLKEDEDFTSKRAIDFINDQYSSKISFTYLSLLEDIIKNYFNIVLKKPPTSADIIDFL